MVEWSGVVWCYVLRRSVVWCGGVLRYYVLRCGVVLCNLMYCVMLCCVVLKCVVWHFTVSRVLKTV